MKTTMFQNHYPDQSSKNSEKNIGPILWETPHLTKARKQEYATKITLTGIFLALFGAFILHVPLVGKNKKPFEIKPFDLILLVFSTLRLGRLVAYDQVAEPWRLPFTQTVPDETGAGETVEPSGAGMQRAFGQLISCPICAGTWIAAALTYGLKILPGPTRAFITIMATMGLVEILDAGTEALSWTGQTARKTAGK